MIAMPQGGRMMIVIEKSKFDFRLGRGGLFNCLMKLILEKEAESIRNISLAVYIHIQNTVL